MVLLSLTPLHQVAVSSVAATVLQRYIQPIIQTLSVIAGLAAVLFMVIGGVQYATSSTDPEKLAHAKRVLKNAAVGLVLVLAASAITSLLTQAYHAPAATNVSTVPALSIVQPENTGLSLVQVLVKTVTGLLNNIIQSIAAPFLTALGSFSTATPLLAHNTSVFNLWLAIVGIADALFVLVVAFLGFHIMSGSVLGMDELSLTQMLPQLAAIFLLMNSSIFLIDGLISFSNVLIHAVQLGLGQTSVWEVLTGVVKQAGSFGVAALLIMLGFLVLAVVLLIYYVLRLVTLYIGAILAPLVLLLWLIPSFKDFVQTATKTYLSNIFVLFIHVIILGLAASLFSGMNHGPSHSPDPLMAMIVGIAALLALLKTQGFMMQLSYASVGSRSMRRLGSQFVNGASFIAGSRPRFMSHPAQPSRGQTSYSQPTSAQSTVFNSSDRAAARQPYIQNPPLIVQLPKHSPPTPSSAPVANEKLPKGSDKV
ncbi:MAG: hypothetical protein NVS1B10_03600 [Candidatus Saccharimonadales bacterium]